MEGRKRGGDGGDLSLVTCGLHVCWVICLGVAIWALHVLVYTNNSGVKHDRAYPWPSFYKKKTMDVLILPSIQLPFVLTEAL